MDAAAMQAFLETCAARPEHLADQLRCLSYHIMPESEKSRIVASFCAEHADEFMAGDIDAGLTMLEIAALHTPAADTDRHHDLAMKFRGALDRLAQEDARRASDIAVLARSRGDRTTALCREASDFLLANDADDSGLLLSGLAEEAAAGDRDFQNRFVNRLERLAGKRPYEAAAALRAFIEQAGLQDNEAVGRASALMKSLSGSPELAREVLEREYGETIAPEPVYIHPQPKQTM